MRPGRVSSLLSFLISFFSSSFSSLSTSLLWFFRGGILGRAEVDSREAARMEDVKGGCRGWIEGDEIEDGEGGFVEEHSTEGA